MKCSKCAAEVPNGVAFCSHCGQPLAAADSAARKQAGNDEQPIEALRSAKSAEAAGENGENSLWQGGYSGKAMIGVWLTNLLITAALIAVSILVPTPITWMIAAILIGLVWLAALLRLAYQKLSVSYELTNRKFVHRSGILVRRIDRIELFEIKDVTTKQNVIQRLLDVGSIEIVSADQSHPRLWLKGIAEAQKIADLIDDTSRPIREKRTLITSH